MEEIQERYNMTTNNGILTEEDQRLMNAIFNLRKNYEIELDKRKCTVQIDPSELKQNPTIIIHKETPKEKQSKKSVEFECICQAVKMDGSPCTSKAKFGNFCGRHKEK